MIYAVIPAYNEEKDIPILLETFSQYPEMTLIIVNDGSTDATGLKIAEAVKKYDLNAYYICHPFNMGLASAIRTGLLNASRIAENTDIIVTLDADNSHHPRWILKLADKINKGYTIAAASRYKKKSRIFGVRIFRQILSNTINLFLRVFFPVAGLKDYTTGFKAYSAELIKQWIHDTPDIIFSDGFTVMSEIAITLQKYHPCCAEIAYDLTYNQKTGTSKINILKTITDYILLVLYCLKNDA